MAEQDTDVLLAMLSSLLNKSIHDQSILLNALVESDGDVERAAALLNSSSGSKNASESLRSSGTKRKRKAGLDGWLCSGTSEKPKTSRPRHEVAPEDASSSSVSSVRHQEPSASEAQVSPSSPSKKLKAVTQEEFMSLLRPPNSAEPKGQGPPKTPPLTLTTPAMVAKNTPCTMHLSILPPELATR